MYILVGIYTNEIYLTFVDWSLVDIIDEVDIQLEGTNNEQVVPICEVWINNINFVCRHSS